MYCSLGFIHICPYEHKLICLVLLCGCCIDMGAMVFEVGLGHMTDPSMVIGCVEVPELSSLVAKGCIEG